MLARLSRWLLKVLLGVTPLGAIVSAAIGEPLPPPLIVPFGFVDHAPAWLWATRYIVALVDVALYAFLGWWTAVLLRLVQGRPWLHRVAGRSVLIGDVRPPPLSTLGRTAVTQLRLHPLPLLLFSPASSLSTSTCTGAMGGAVLRSIRVEALRALLLNRLVWLCVREPGRSSRAPAHAPRRPRLAARRRPPRRPRQRAHDGGGGRNPLGQPGLVHPKLWRYVRVGDDRPLVV